MDEMSIPKRAPPIHAKEPTIYYVEIRVCLTTEPLGAGTYRVGRYRSVVLQ